MLWNRSKTLALADQQCSVCYGLGQRLRGGKEIKPCACVFRSIFRACHRRFRDCASIERTTHATTRHGTGQWGRKDEEYCADFVLTARRALAAEDNPALLSVFRLHFLLGADYKLINRQLGRRLHDRDTFHLYYLVEELVGRAFAELSPYALWPLDSYFAGDPLSGVGASRAPAAAARRLPFPLAAAE